MQALQVESSMLRSHLASKGASIPKNPEETSLLSLKGDSLGIESHHLLKSEETQNESSQLQIASSQADHRLMSELEASRELADTRLTQLKQVQAESSALKSVRLYRVST